MLDNFAVVPWYPSERCYQQFRCTADDFDAFFSTYDEWLAAALEHERRAEANGVTILRIRVAYEAFEQWRSAQGARNDAAGRSAFAETRARILLGWKFAW